MLIDLMTPAVSTRPKPSCHYDDDNERVFHLAEIAAIAHDNRWPIAEVAECYERILAELKQRADVHDYLHVFVAKKVMRQMRTTQCH